MEDRWKSVDEIGIYLGIKRDTVYRWISEKTMPAHKVGRLWKLKKDEVDTWVKTGGAAEPMTRDKNDIDSDSAIPSILIGAGNDLNVLLCKLQNWRHHQFAGFRPFFCQVEAVETAI